VQLSWAPSIIHMLLPWLLFVVLHLEPWLLPVCCAKDDNYTAGSCCSAGCYCILIAGHFLRATTGHANKDVAFAGSRTCVRTEKQSLGYSGPGPGPYLYGEASIKWSPQVLPAGRMLLPSIDLGIANFKWPKDAICRIGNAGHLSMCVGKHCILSFQKIYVKYKKAGAFLRKIIMKSSCVHLKFLK